MYNSQYYTCEQIDERLLQGYVDDYNTQTGQSLTKEQFLTKLGNIFTNWQGVDDVPTAGSSNLVKSGGVANAINIINKEVFNFLDIPVVASGYVPCAPWNEPINKDYVTTSDVWNHNVLPCNAGDIFKISGLGGGTPRLFAFIDNNGNLCGEENIGYAPENFTGDNLDITAPVNSAYLIVNFNIQHHPTGNNLKKLDISSSKIPEKVNIKKGWNLFNPEDSDVAVGYFIYNNSGALSGGGTAVYNTSGFIPVTPSTTYYKASNASKGFRFVLCYNANKEAISSSFINDDCNSFTTPENAAYVRVTFYQSDYDNAQVSSSEKVYQQYSEIGGYLENIQNVVANQGVQIGIIEVKCADGTTVVTKTDTNGSQFLPSDFGLTKFEKGTILEVYGNTDGTTFMLYGNRGSGNEQIIGYLSQDKYYPSSIVLEYDYVSLSSYSDNSTRTKTSVSLQSKLSYANDAVNRIKDGHSQNAFQSSKNFTSSGSETIQPSVFGLQKFEKGLTLEVYGETDGTTLLFYGNRGSGNELLIGRVSRDANKPSILTLEDDYINLVYYSNSATQTSIYITIYGKGAYMEKEIQDLKVSQNIPCKVLYIGDSYTEMARWTTEFEKMVNVSEKLNLGISSADLKDIQSDITAYPYGSRPYNGILGADGEEGNLNVFSSQIEQLKRIKSGNLHGILWKSAFSAPSSNGTITFAFAEGTKTVEVLSTDSANDVAEKVAQISTSDYIITHPSGYDYVAIEALSNSVDTIPTITSSVVTVNSSILKYKESYPFTSDPNVVIIAGGKNDLLDTDIKVESYQSQIVHQANVYYKKMSEQSATQGTIYVPTNASDVDRTCFCGSLRHIMEEIHSLYEDALIIVVGPSNLNYGGVNIDNDKKKDEQLSTAASYLSIPYISWFKNGIMCNRVFNKPSGSGTQNDPYILDSETDYTIDMMHPNYAGGKYLANNVAVIVKSYINNLI